MVTSVPVWPSVGATLVTEPCALYVKPFDCVTDAPESATTTTSPVLASFFCATTTTASSLSDLMSADTPARVTESTLLPLPRRVVPEMVTDVPSWPTTGLMLVILLGVLYVNRPLPVTMAPESETMTMSPDSVLEETLACTTTSVALDDLTVAFSPTRVTDAAF